MSTTVPTAKPQEVGIDPARLERFFEVADRLVAESFMFGGSFLIARKGRVVAARGVGQSDPSRKRAARPDDVYTIFSTTKPLSATLTLMAIDQGKVRLIDKIADWIPEFAEYGKADVTIAQALTHTAGFAALAPDWGIDNWTDWNATIARICAQPVQHVPGTAVDYHALTANWILAEVARRADGGKRPFAEMAAEDLFRPLGMKDTHLGVRADLRERLVPLKALDRGGFPFPTEFLEVFDSPHLQTACIPGGGGRSTVYDLFRFYQAYLNGGVLDGARILSPAMVELATTNHTGDAVDRLFEPICMDQGWKPFPANRGLSFWLRGTGIHPSNFGSLASPRAFGHPGAGSIMAWADPIRDLVFVGLTAGIILEHRHIRRMHTLSDLAQACVVD
jgi:CubicO group peptidase (beta-lactamase class C family)